jgi:hypothetical protein
MDKPVKKITSFRKLPKAAEPAKPTINQNPGIPGLMKPGTVLTEIEKEGLRQLGIVDDPSKLPSNIAEKIHAAVSDSSKLSEMVAPTTPLKIPEPVDFSELPEEKKKDIVNFIKEAADMRKQEQAKKVDKTDPPLDPKIFKEPEVIDDLIDAPKPSPVTSTASTEEPEKKINSDSGVFNTDAAIICPHCGWDTRKKEMVEVTDDDKMDFVQSILGGIRFKKVYELFGGRLRVTFRTLTTAESDMAYKQLIVDAQNDVQSKILGDTSFYWRTLMAYRAIIAVEKVESSENIVEIPPVNEIDVDEDSYKKPNTKLSALFDDLVEQIMPTEIIRNTISHLYTEFQSLCEKLQAMSESKDFWKATK